MIGRVALVALVALLLSACSFDEALEFVNGSGGSVDLRDPAQPTEVQAAGSVADAEAAEQRATEAITQALDPATAPGTRIGLASNAIEARPGNPRFWIYRAWFNQLAGDKTAANADMAQASGLTTAAHPGDEGTRRMKEHFLDTTLAILRTYPEGSETRNKMVVAYCTTMFAYKASFGDSLLGTAYIEFNVQPDLCS